MFDPNDGYGVSLSCRMVFQNFNCNYKTNLWQLLKLRLYFHPIQRFELIPKGIFHLNAKTFSHQFTNQEERKLQTNFTSL